MGILTQTRRKIKIVWNGIFNKKPAYRITRNGVEVKYWNLKDTENLPFDPETYSDTQIFIGNWANPWYFNIDEIENEFDNFAEENITKIEDIWGKPHLYPSQRWKTLANQSVLENMLYGSGFDMDRLERLMYAAIGGIAMLIILVISGGV